MIKNELYNKCKKLTVLLVEDYIPLQEKISSFLGDYFNEIHVASDGEEGLDKYVTFEKKHSVSYDIVISDYEMPKMNGIELIENIKAYKSNQVCIVISAHQNPEYLIEFINLGILHFIAKPIQLHQMLTVLNKVSEMFLPKESDILILSKSHIWNTENKSLSYKGQYIKLSKYDVLLFEILIQNIDAPCSYEQILDYFYLFSEDIQKDNIRNMIIRLRKKIPNIRIESLYGLGFKLNVID